MHGQPAGVTMPPLMKGVDGRKAEIRRGFVRRQVGAGGLHDALAVSSGIPKSAGVTRKALASRARSRSVG
jgi:hypothetical protein